MKTAMLIAAVVLAAAASAAPALAQSGDARKGREVFVKVGCWGCHGYAGQGGVAGPKIAPDPLPTEALVAYLRNASGTRMPPYDAKGLPDGDIAHIRAYLASIPKTGDWKSVPLLKN